MQKKPRPPLTKNIGVAELRAAAEPEDAAVLPQRRGGDEADIHDLAQNLEKGDDADKELGLGDAPVCRHLRGQSPVMNLAFYTKNVTGSRAKHDCPAS